MPSVSLIKWSDKLYSKESNAKVLSSRLAGALRNKRGDFSLSKISFLVLGLIVLIGAIYLVSALEEITIVDLNTTDSYGFGVNYTWENLTAYVSNLNSSQKYIYDWRVDGESIALINAPFDGDLDSVGSNGTQGVKDYSKYNSTIIKGTSGSSDDPSYVATGGYDGKGYYEFDGTSNKRITILADNANLSTLGDEITVSLWIKTNSISLSEENIFFQHWDTTDERWYIYQNTNNKLCIYNDIDNKNEVYCSTFTFSSGEWIHVVVSIDNVHWKLYVDGELEHEEIDAVSGFNAMNKNGNRFYLGTRRVSTTYGKDWDGGIDEYMIFNRSLSAEQIGFLSNNESDKIFSGETIAGEDWGVCVTPNDNETFGSTVCSSGLGILSPYIDEVVINSSNGDNSTGENLSVSLVNLTLDSSDVIYDWRVDGMSFADLNMPFEIDVSCGASGDKICDFSSNSNNGTVGSGVSYNSTGGHDGRGAYEFDGSEGSITVFDSSQMKFQGDMSAMMWAKGNSLTSDVSLISYSSTGNNLATNYQYNLKLKTNGSLEYFHEYDAEAYDVRIYSENINVDTSEWHHYAFVRDSVHKVVIFYVDGEQVGDAISYPTDPNGGTSSIFYIGRSSSGTYWDGVIDDVVVFNRSLSVEQIRYAYNNQSVVSSKETRADENWSVVATPVYSQQFGASVTSDSLTVLPPSFGSVFLNSTPDNLNGTWENLTVNFVDLVSADKVIYDWYENGESSLISYMSFDDEVSGLDGSVLDYVGGHNGTLGSETLSTRPFLNVSGGYDGRDAYVFDGVDDFINVSTIVNQNISTISFWIKPAGINGDETGIAGQRFDAGEEKGNWDLRFNNSNHLWLLAYSGSGSSYRKYLFSKASLSAGQWYHVVMTYDEADDISLYLDGVLQETVNHNIGAFGGSGNDDELMIGRAGSESAWKYFNGTIDDVKLFSDALNSEQIALLASDEEAVIPESKTVSGENWSVCATPFYYADVGEEVCSNSLTVLSPSIDSVVLNTSTGDNLTTEILNTSIFDIRPSEAKVIYDWRKGGSSIAKLNMPMDGGAFCGVGEDKICDYSTDENNGTISTGVSYNSTGGYDGNGAYEFIYNHAGITVANDDTLYLQGSMTFMAWAKYNNLDSDMTLVAYSKKGGDTGDNYQYRFQLKSTGILEYSHEYDTQDFFKANSSNTLSGVNADEWHHYAFVRDDPGSTLTLYVDGVQVGDVWDFEGLEPVGGSDASFYIGTDTSNNDWNGSIDEVMVFDVALSASQVQNYLNSSKIMDSPLTAVGDNWSICATPNNEEYEGESVCSNSLIVRPNIVFDNVSAIDNNGTTVSFTDENGSVSTPGFINRGENVTFNVTLTNWTSIDKVWIKIWDNIIGGTFLILDWLTDLGNGVWQIVININESFVNEEYNITIYANTTDGFETNVSSYLDIDPFKISFVAPTPSNESYLQNPAEVNISSEYEIGDHYSLFDLDKDLLVWYSFENSSGLLFNDSSSYGNHLNSSSNISGFRYRVNNSHLPYGDSLDINYGSGVGGGIISTKNITIINSSWSVGFWMSSNGGIDHFGQIIFINDFYIGVDNEGEDSGSQGICDNDDRDFLQIGVGSSNLEFDCGGDIDFNEIYHYTFVGNGTAIILYKNGAYFNSQTFTFSSQTGKIYLGEKTNNKEFFGFLDEVVIFNRSLSAEEVEFLYNATNATINFGDNYRSLNLTEGEHTITAGAVSESGEMKTEYREFTIDETKPNVSLLSPVDGTETQNSTIEFGFNATDYFQLGNVTVYVWNAFGDLAYNSSVDISGVNNESFVSVSEIELGNYEWGMLVNDAAGNANWSENNFSFTVFPSVDSVILNATSIYNLSRDDLGAYPVNTNHDYADVLYEWYKNGTISYVSIGNSSYGNTVPSWLTEIEDSWVVNVTPKGLTNNFNLSYVSYNNAFLVSAYENDPRGMTFNPDGTKLYIIGDDRAVIQYDLGVSYNVLSALYVNEFSVGSQDLLPTDVDFNFDGTKMFVAGNNNNELYEYNLTVPYEVSSASYFASYSLPDNRAYSVEFSNDGMTLYVLENTDYRISQYSLTEPFNVSSRVLEGYLQTPTFSFTEDFDVSLDGSVVYVVDSFDDTLKVYSLSDPWNFSTGINVYNLTTSSENDPKAVTISGDGTKMFYVGLTGDKVYVYDIGDVVDGVTVTSNSIIVNENELANVTLVSPVDDFADEDLNITLEFNATDDFGLLNATIYVWNISGNVVLVDSGNISGIFNSSIFNFTDLNPGKYFWNALVCDSVKECAWAENNYSFMILPVVESVVLNASSVNNLTYNTFTAYPINSNDDDFGVSYEWYRNGDFLYSELVGSPIENSLPAEMVFAGDVLYVNATSKVLVNNYELSDSTYVGNFSIAGQETLSRSLEFNNDGTKMYVIGSSNRSVHEYDLDIPFNVSNATYVNVFSFGDIDYTPTGLAFNNDGTKMYMLGGYNRKVNEYNLSSLWNVSTASLVGSYGLDNIDYDPEDLEFNNDGSKVFVIGKSGDRIIEYDLSTAYDSSTSSYIGFFSLPDGSPSGFEFNNDGLKMFVVDFDDDVVYEYDLGSSFDISTLNYVRYFSISSYESSPQSIEFNDDGTKMYILGLGSDKVYEFNLGSRVVGETIQSNSVVVVADSYPNVTLISPEDGNETSVLVTTVNSSVYFIFNTTDDFGLVNATLYVWDGAGNVLATNFSNLSGTFNETNWSLVGFNSGTYFWNVYVNDFYSQGSFAGSNWSFSIIPETPVVFLNATSAENMTYDNLTASVSYAPSWATNFTYDWYKDGVLNNSVNDSSVLDSSMTFDGDVWFVNVTLFNSTYIGESYLSNNLTVVGEINISDVVPAENTMFNVSDSIEIGANVSSTSVVDSVYVNITISNGTVERYDLSNVSDWYNISYTIPTVLGRYNVTFFVNDSGGNVGTAETSFFVGEDSVSPSVFFIDFVNGTLTSGSYSQDYIYANISATDNVEVDTMIVRLYNSSDVVYENSTNESNLFVNYTGLPEGNYFLNATANDTSGNFGYSETLSIVLDVTSPSVSIISPIDGTNTSDVTPEVRFNITDDSSASINYSVFIDGASVSHSGDGVASSAIEEVVIVTDSLTVGEHVLAIVGMDSSGNEVYSSSVTFDVFPPVIYLRSPEYGGILDDTNITFSFDVIDYIYDNLMCNLSIDNVLNQVDFNASVNETNNFSSVVLSDGSHSWFVSCVNGEGVFINDTFVFDINSLVPSVENVVPASNSTFNVSQEIEIGANITDANGIGSVYINVTIPNGTVEKYDLTNVSDWYNVSYVIPGVIGQYNITFFANDSYGNVNSSETTFFVGQDFVAPVIEFVNNSLESGSYNMNYIYANISVDENVEIDVLTIRLYNSSEVINESSTNESLVFVNYPGLVEGQYYLNATANDTSGNFGISETLNIVLDRTSPVVDVIFPMNGTNTSDVTPTISFNFTDNLDSIIVFDIFIDGSDVSASSNRFADVGEVEDFFLTDPLDLYNHTLVVRGTDDAGNTVNSSTIYFNVVPPVVFLESPSSFEVLNDSNVSFSIEATDVIYDYLMCNMSVFYLNLTEISNETNLNATVGVISNFSNTVVLNDGYYRWGAYCINNENTTVNDTVTFSVDVLSPTLSVTDPENNSDFTVSDEILMKVTSTDYFDIELVYANITMPNGTIETLNLSDSGIFDIYNLSYEIPAVAGIYNVLFVSTDTNGRVNSTSILFSAKPNISEVILNSSLNANVTIENLTSYVSGLIPNDSRVIYDWKVNDSSIAVLNMPFDTGEACGVGENLTCDYSTFENNATVNGASWTTFGYLEGGYEFDGVDDYVEIEYSQDFNFSDGDGFTVMTWFRPNDLVDGGLRGDIVGHYYSVGDNRGWALQVYDGEARFAGCHNGTSASCDYAYSGVDVNESDIWYHVTGSWNGSHLQTYVNGISEGIPKAMSNIYYPTNRNVRIGYGVTGSAYMYNGTIDEVMIFNRSLSEEQIFAIYSNRSDLIVSGETFVGDNWSVGVTPSDGGLAGDMVLSEGLVILADEPPVISGIVPAENSTFNVSQTIEIGANVNDLTEVDYVYVNVTIPNGTVEKYDLTNVSDWYNVSYTIPEVIGQYNVTFVANDSYGNVNDFNTTFFVGEDFVVPVIEFVNDSLAEGYYSQDYIYANLTVSDNVEVDTLIVRLYNSSGLVFENSTNESSLFVNYTGLSEDDYYLNATANDSSGNLGYSETRNITMDVTNPSVEIVSPNSTTYDNEVVTLNISTDADNVLYNYNGTNYSYSSVGPVLFGEGNFTLFVYVSDLAGNSNSTSVNFSINFSGPSIQIISPISKFYDNETVLVNVTSNAESTWYSYSGTDIDYVGAFNLTLSDEDYILRVYGNDSAGVVTEEIVNFTIDTILPVIEIFSPENMSYNAEDVLVNISSSDVNLEDVWYNYNGTNYSYSAALNITFIEGVNELIVYANDSAGNFNSTFISFTIDTTVPDLSIVSPIATTYADEIVLLNISSSGNFTWYNYNGTNVTYLGVVNLTLNDSSYDLDVWANDTAGNLNYTSVDFIVDTTAPIINIVSPQDNQTYNYKNISIMISSDGDNIWYNYNGTNVSYSGLVLGNFSEGSNALTAYANDSAGNFNSTLISFEVNLTAPDTVAPSIMIHSPEDITYNVREILVNVTVIDSNVDSAWFDDGESNVSYSSAFNYTFAQGNNILRVYANDTEGNLGAEEVSFVVDMTVIINSTLENTTVIFSNVTNSTINNSYIEDSVIDSSNITNSNITDSDLTNSTVDNSNVTDSVVDDSTLNNSVVDGSNITDSIVDNSTLEDSNITNSNITDSDLTNSTVDDSNVTDSTLEDSVIDNSDLMNSNVTDSIVDNSTLEDSNITNSNITDSDLANSIVDNSNVTDSIVDNSTLNNSVVDGSNLTDSILESTNMTNSTFVGSNTTESVFNNSNAENSTFINSTIDSSNITNSVIEDSVIEDSVIEDSTIYDSILNNVTLINTLVINTTLTNITSYNATIIDGYCYNGTVGYQGVNYTCPVDIDSDVYNSTVPNVSIVGPAVGGYYNVSNVVSFVVNSTDLSGVSNVTVNVILSNGTVEVFELNNTSGDIFEGDYTIPFVIGRHNVTVISIDYVGNVNDSETTYFFAEDVTNPGVLLISPTRGTVLAAPEIVEIAVNVSDDVEVDRVFVNVSYPNNTIVVLELANSGDGKYNVSFNASVDGAYFANFSVNDTSGNLNSSVTTYFGSTVTIGDIMFSNESIYDMSSEFNESEIVYDENLTYIAANCSSNLENIESVEFRLFNVEDSETYFNSVHDYNISERYVVNSSYVIRDSGNWTLYVTCNTSSYSLTENKTWEIGWGNIAIDWISPTGDSLVQIYELSNFSANISCSGGECGEVNVTLDPHEVTCAEEEVCVNVGSVDCINETVDSCDENCWNETIQDCEDITTDDCIVYEEINGTATEECLEYDVVFNCTSEELEVCEDVCTEDVIESCTDIIEESCTIEEVCNLTEAEEDVSNSSNDSDSGESNSSSGNEEIIEENCMAEEVCNLTEVPDEEGVEIVLNSSVGNAKIILDENVSVLRSELIIIEEEIKTFSIMNSGDEREFEYKTPILAVELATDSGAVITLPKNLDSNLEVIVKCDEWDFNLSECSSEWFVYATVDELEQDNVSVTFEVDSFSAYAGGDVSSDETSFLTVWDENDVGMSGAVVDTTSVKIVNENVTFFADYKIAKNATKISDGDCNITINGSEYEMVYDGSAYYRYTMNMTEVDAYDYFIDCSHSVYDDLNSSDRVVIGTLSNSSKGVISTTIGDVPFYTIDSNPQNISLRGGDSEIVSWRVNATGVLNKVYDFFVEVVGDIIGYTNSSHLDITISANDTTDPVFVWGGTTPSIVLNGSNVVINANVEDNVQTDSIWGVITHPISGFNTSFVGVPYNFTNTSESGRYNLTFYANDSSGNNKTYTSWFEVAELLNITLNISVEVDVEVNVSEDFVFRLVSPDFGDTILEIETNSSFVAQVPDAVYDFMFFSLFNGTMNLTLSDVNLSTNLNGSIKLDKHKQESDYLVVYGVETGYSFSTSEAVFGYVGESYGTEANLQLWKCDGNDYDFNGRSCTGSWGNVTSGATHYTDGDYFVYDTTSFSGFAIKEYVASVVEEEESSSSGGGGGGGGCSEGYEFVNNVCQLVVEEAEDNVTDAGIPEELFDITFNLDDSTIQSSDELSGIVTFESFGTIPTFVNLTFSILDETGNEIYYVLSNITVTTEEILRWNYDTLQDLPNGKYTAVFTSLYNVDVFDEFKQEFEVGKEKGFFSIITGNVVGWVGVGVAGVLVFVGLVFLAWWLVKKRKKGVAKRIVERPRAKKEIKKKKLKGKPKKSYLGGISRFTKTSHPGLKGEISKIKSDSKIK